MTLQNSPERSLIRQRQRELAKEGKKKERDGDTMMDVKD